MGFFSLFRGSSVEERKRRRGLKARPQGAPRGSVREMENEYYLQPLRCLFPGWFRRNG